MSNGKLSGLLIGFTLVLFSAVGCIRIPAAAPVAEAPVATPTPVSPTVAPAPQPQSTSAPQPAKPTPELRAVKITSPALTKKRSELSV